MKPFKLIILMCTGIFFTTVTWATEPLHGIEVSGKAAVKATPNKFVLSLAIVERGKSASKTKALVDQKTTQLVNAAKKAGVKSDDIQSARMSLRPIYLKSAVSYKDIEVNEQFVNDKTGRIHLNKTPKSSVKQKYIFEVSRQITLQFINVEDYDRLLDRFVKIGVTNISPLSMSVSNVEKLYQQALAKAIKVAKEKAQHIAAQAGVSLGKLTALKEMSYNAPVRMNMAFSQEGAFHQSQVGKQQITAEVLATFAIEE